MTPPAEEGRPDLDFGDTTQFLQSLHPIWQHYAAVERADEGRVLYLRTWYTDHLRHPRCDEDRGVRLLNDPWRWPEAIAERWDDLIDPDVRIDLHLVRPSPRTRSWEDADAVPHIIVVQRPREDLRSIHVTVIDPAHVDTPLNSFVLAGPRIINKRYFLVLLGILDESIVESLVDCMVWHGEMLLDHNDFIRAQHGFSFLVILNHLRDIITRAAAASSASGHNALNLLQIDARRTKIQLDDLISAPSPLTQQTLIALRVVWGLDPGPHPDFVEVSGAATTLEIAEEFHKWGISCRPVACFERDAVVCLGMDEGHLPRAFHYVFVNLDLDDKDSIFLHTHQHVMDELTIMRHLYGLGCWRAVVISSQEPFSQMYKITFRNQQVTMACPPHREKLQPTWPPPQTGGGGTQRFFHGHADFSSDTLIDIGIKHKDINDLFGSHDAVLQQDFGSRQPPAEILEAITACDPGIADCDLDRLLIYADGSSLGALKQVPPLRAEMEGLGDTWAYVVVGERYHPPGLKFMGWSSQAVHYEESSNMHIGASRLGADMAEKEGLAWAALWRLSQNWSIATCFRSDSRTALGQAEGTVGTTQVDEIFGFMRGVFQAVESALEPHNVAYSHVPGHAGEVWNELCDWLAKEERRSSFYCPRPTLDVQKWKRAMGHTWMLFNQHDDLPAFCGVGFHAPPPSLPSGTTTTLLPSKPQHRHRKLVFTMSVCSANVQSLSSGPQGHAGKIAYLRQQVRALHFNFLGIQEAKTQETCTYVDHVYRLASGCERHQQGVELWINMAQPYGHLNGKPCYFEKGDFQITHKDPRILMVRVDTQFWNGWIVVAYAPQSGISRGERADWWQHFAEVTQSRREHEPLIVMIDANASPGDFDGKAVYKRDLATSSSTEFMREFAEAHDLFLPCTTSAHVGDICTWTDPSGMHSYCIDYIILSRHFADACKTSQIAEEFDNASSDHVAPLVELEWTETVQVQRPKKQRSPAYDATQISATVVADILQNYTPAAWHTDIESQVDNLNEAILHGLCQACPKSDTQAKKPYMSEELWQLRQHKLQTRKRLKDISRRQREESLVCFFRLWHAVKKQDKPISGIQMWEYGNFLLLQSLRCSARLYHYTTQLRGKLKNAKQNHIKAKIESLPEGASAATILHEMRPILGPSNLKKVKTATLPYVRKENGEICTLPNEAVDTWLTFFSTMEAGERLPLDEQRELWIRNLAALQQSSFIIDGEHLPRLLDLEAALRRVNPQKATGPDHVHPRFCCAAPHRLARKLYGALMKLLTHGQESLCHKGGLLHPVWKAKGAKDFCTSFRSILVSSHIGKSLHRSIRQHQTTLFSAFLQREQIGGRPRAPVTLGVHIGRAFLRARKAQGHNVAMLYLDLTEAFYRILRPLVVGGEIEDELVLYVGARLGLTEDLLADLHRHLAEPTAVECAHLPRHLQLTLRALHQDTHFHVKGQEDSCRTRLGSRPGDCFADVIFSYLWCRILTRLQDQLSSLGIGEVFPKQTGLVLKADEGDGPIEYCSFLGPTWMDDTCVCISDVCPQALEHKITQAASELLSLCDSHGLTPNLSPGKTEALLVFQGRGSKQMRVKYFGPNSENVITTIGERGLRKIKVVGHYTHLGCVIHHRSDNRKEARRRIGIAQQAFTQHRRHLLQNPQLQPGKRIELFKTLILSRFSFGTESWTFEDCKSREHVHNSLMRLFRRLLKVPHDAHLTDEDILVGTGLNSPTEILRISRLRYLGTLYRCGDLVPWGLLNSDTEWKRLLADDLDWMWMQLRAASSMSNPADSIGQWESLWLYHPSYWKRLVRRAGEHAILQRQRSHRVGQFHGRFCLLFEQVLPGHFKQHKVERSPIETEEVHACMQCRQVFASKGGLGAHCFKRHGTVAKVRFLFDKTSCGACLKEYHTFSKLQAHLRNSGACRRALWGRRRYNGPSHGTGSVIDRQLCQQHDGILPPLQGHGPHLPARAPVEIPEYDLELAECIYMALVECEDKNLVEQVVREILSTRSSSWRSCRASLYYMLEELTAEDIEALDLGDIDVKQILNFLATTAAWPFLLEAPTHARTILVEEQLATCELASQDGIAKAGRQEKIWPVPRPMARERYIIHAFSGRRRMGDFQHFVDAASRRQPDAMIFTISVDLMVDPVWGDVSRPEVRSFWISAVKDRFVVGCMAGPPCETWSQARGKQPAAETTNEASRRSWKGPRVLRDLEEIWGRA